VFEHVNSFSTGGAIDPLQAVRQGRAMEPPSASGMHIAVL